MELALQSDELFQIMKGRMTTEHEQIFMASHYLYLEHGTDNTKFVVDFDDVWKNVDFTRKDNAKRILVKNFIEQIDYKKVEFTEMKVNSDENLAPPKRVASCDDNMWGGQNKETIMLTVDCFKNFCMIASTPKAKVIRSYYIKMENIMHEYYKNFKAKNDALQIALDISVKETAIKRHEVLIESNKNKWVVYFCRIRLNDDGSFILKIGESTDIKNRIEALSCDFDTSIIVLDVFNCENSLRFERFLHNSKELVKYKYNHLEHKNKTLSTEAYHIPTQKEYERLIKFAKTELNKYNSIEIMKLRGNRWFPLPPSFSRKNYRQGGGKGEPSVPSCGEGSRQINFTTPIGVMHGDKIYVATKQSLLVALGKCECCITKRFLENKHTSSQGTKYQRSKNRFIVHTLK
jgi:phage anti-repressor protein